MSITPAASVLLSRGPGSREVFAILRSPALRFFGGFWAFPGGKLAPQDMQVVGEPSDALPNLDAHRITACRELFEETGILIARRPDGSFPSPGADLDSCRHALLADQLAFGKMLAERNLTAHESDFRYIGVLTTPAFSPLRYATAFFDAHLPPGQQPSIWPGELERGEWIEGATILGRWKRGECLLTPPSLMCMEVLGEQPIDEAPSLLGPVFAKLAAGAIHPIFFAPHMQVVPLRTVALPPSAYTNAFIIGNGPRYLIDPGPDDPQEQQVLCELLAAQPPLTAIVLTHHHPDHIGAAQACAQRFGLPIWAHRQTAERLQDRLSISRHLQEGDQLDLGTCPANGKPWSLNVLHTPGHASGHLVFFEPIYRVLFAGDMISTMTSIVISPPDGDLSVYLDSLRRLRALPSRLLLPSHGNVSTQPTQLIDDALEHRRKRELQLLESLAESPGSIDELTARLYRGTPEVLMRFARAQTLAGLLKLQREGKASPVDHERWARC